MSVSSFNKRFTKSVKLDDFNKDELKILRRLTRTSLPLKMFVERCTQH